jgi:hypothetical protein
MGSQHQQVEAGLDVDPQLEAAESQIAGSLDQTGRCLTGRRESRPG